MWFVCLFGSKSLFSANPHKNINYPSGCFGPFIMFSSCWFLLILGSPGPRASLRELLGTSPLAWATLHKFCSMGPKLPSEMSQPFYQLLNPWFLRRGLSLPQDELRDPTRLSGASTAGKEDTAALGAASVDSQQNQADFSKCSNFTPKKQHDIPGAPTYNYSAVIYKAPQSVWDLRIDKFTICLPLVIALRKQKITLGYIDFCFLSSLLRKSK